MNIPLIRTELERAHGQRIWKHWGKGVDVLVETILSQNTSDRNSAAGYRQLRRKFKSWNQVIIAPVEEVERHIRVSGLSKIKAPRIQAILRQIKEERGKIDLEFLKDWPAEEAFEYLMRFKGVGPKTAYCVLLFSFGMEVYPVDTHIHRMARRLGWIDETVSPGEAHEILNETIRPRDRYAMHLLMIEHGRTVCKAQRPRCAECGLVADCLFGRSVQASSRGRNLRVSKTKKMICQKRVG